MTCQELLRAIDAYLDGELSVMETLRMQGHLIFCEPCRKLVESEALLHSLVSTDAIRDQAPAQLRERILQRVAAPPPPLPASRLGPWRSTIPRVSLAAVAILALLLGVLMLPGVRGPVDLQPLAAELASKHLLYAHAGTALEMTTSEAPRMAAWLERRLGFSVKLPLLARPGERLVGGRVSSVADAPAAYLLYERNGRRISLLIMQPPPLARRGGVKQVVEGVELYTTALRGIALVWWEDAERFYAAASTAGMKDVLEFALRCVRSKPPSHGGHDDPDNAV